MCIPVFVHSILYMCALYSLHLDTRVNVGDLRLGRKGSRKRWGTGLLTLNMELDVVC